MSLNTRVMPSQPPLVDSEAAHVLLVVAPANVAAVDLEWDTAADLGQDTEMGLGRHTAMAHVSSFRCRELGSSRRAGLSPLSFRRVSSGCGCPRTTRPSRGRRPGRYRICIIRHRRGSASGCLLCWSWSWLGDGRKGSRSWPASPSGATAAQPCRDRSHGWP